MISGTGRIGYWGNARPRVGVIIPALNEEKAVGLVLRDIPLSIVDQVIVVDNGSSDNTVREAGSYGAIVKCEPRRGYGAACLRGVEALRPDIDIVVFLDADYSDHPEEIEALLSPICENRVDLVIGSRTLSDASRKALSWQGPFRAIRREVLEALSIRDRGYGWTVEMQVKAMCAGLRVVEVPVRYRPRIGHSKISGTLKGSMCAGAKILCTIGKYSFTSRSHCRTFARRTSAET